MIEGQGLAPCSSAISLSGVSISPMPAVTETECQSCRRKLSQKSILTHRLILETLLSHLIVGQAQ